MILYKNIWNEKFRCAEFSPRNEIVSKAKNAKQRQQIRVKMLNDKELFCSTKKNSGYYNPGFSYLFCFYRYKMRWINSYSK